MNNDNWKITTTKDLVKELKRKGIASIILRKPGT